MTTNERAHGAAHVPAPAALSLQGHHSRTEVAQLSNRTAERFQNSPVRINHYGYLKSVVESRDKRERNLQLLKQQAADEGADDIQRIQHWF